MIEGTAGSTSRKRGVKILGCFPVGGKDIEETKLVAIRSTPVHLA